MKSLLSNLYELCFIPTAIDATKSLIRLLMTDKGKGFLMQTLLADSRKKKNLEMEKKNLKWNFDSIS